MISSQMLSVVAPFQNPIEPIGVEVILGPFM